MQMQKHNPISSDLLIPPPVMSRPKLVADASQLIKPQPQRAKPQRAKRVDARAQRRKVLNKLQSVLTLVLGVGIPGLTLGLSNLLGKLHADSAESMLTYGAAVVLASVLLVSISHVAHGIQEITRAPTLHAWCMAIAIDASLVVCEATNVMTDMAPRLCWAIIGGVAVISASLNVYAFKLGQHKRRPRRK